ncbi:MAG: aminoglycoside phosphotransferase [Egibacteraceae bacterium]
MLRTNWDDLPEGVRSAIESRTGQVLTAETASEGRNCQVAALLHTRTEKVFVKGMRSDHPRVWTQQMEAMINPWVLKVAPRLLWHVQADGWDVLGFECIDGRHADYSPGSADLVKVIQAMRRLGGIPAPDLPLKRAEQRWADCADDESELMLLCGDSLLHTDFNPCNILVNGTAWIVDWAWPTRGAGWIDPACLILRLLAAGQTPAGAEAWARQVPSWNAASDQAIDTFAKVNCRLWEEIAQADPQAWKKQLAAAAQEWLVYRLS